jgi:hypothetical protein
MRLVVGYSTVEPTNRQRNYSENLRAIAHITRQTTTDNVRHNLSARTEFQIQQHAYIGKMQQRTFNSTAQLSTVQSYSWGPRYAAP